MRNTLKNWIPASILDGYKGSFYTEEWPTLPQMLRISTDRCGTRPFFTDFDEQTGEKITLTYIQAKEKIDTLALWLCAQGVKKGDRVAVTGKNSPEWATVYLATVTIGAIICPLDYALHIEEQENLLFTAEPKVLFVDEEKYDSYIKKEYAFKVFSLSKKYEQNYVYNLKTQEKIEYEEPKLEDTAAILFTSGTTSTPKGVMLSHKNFVSDAFIAQDNLYIDCYDTFYALLPLHHAYTMQAVFIESLCIGAEVLFGKSMAVSRMMRDLKEGNITMMLGVPLLFNKLASGVIKGLKAKGIVVYGVIRFLMAISYIIKKVFGVNPGKKMFKAVLQKANLYTIRIAISGGGPLSKKVFKFFNEMGIDFIQGYGLTETSPIIALNPKEHFKIESVGKYFVGKMQMKILNPNEDNVGEICVKGPMVMQGYYKMPEETAKVFTEDGWFKTGDLGYLDSENYLMLSGRVKNMIVTEGGKNVYPEEIEDKFQLETDIQQITVQGYIADESKSSEELEALVYPSDTLFERLKIKREDSVNDKTVYKTVESIVSAINKTLQPYQRITKITILQEPLAMTTTLKVKRNYKK